VQSRRDPPGEVHGGEDDDKEQTSDDDKEQTSDDDLKETSDDDDDIDDLTIPSQEHSASLKSTKKPNKAPIGSSPIIELPNGM
jgi:hypothetical protein